VIPEAVTDVQGGLAARPVGHELRPALSEPLRREDEGELSTDLDRDRQLVAAGLGQSLLRKNALRLLPGDRFRRVVLEPAVGIDSLGHTASPSFHE
jgi:hypothetical protein